MRHTKLSVVDCLWIDIHIVITPNQYPEII